MLQIPFYDPSKSYEDNYKEGPFGVFSDNITFSKRGEPNYEFLGQKVYLPFGIPAGPLLNGKFVKAALRKGFDVSVYKTVRTKSNPTYPWPNVLAVKVEGDITLEKAQQGLTADTNYQEPLSITNSFGVPSMDPDIWQPDMSDAIKATGIGQVVIGSFQGTKSQDGDISKYIADFVLGAKLVKETGAKILEANLSCPNEGTADLLCFDTERVFAITTAIKEEIGNTPLIIKIAYSKKNLSEYVKKLGNVVDGFSAINTIPAKILDKDGNQALSGEGRLISGTCGHGIKWAGLDMAKRLVDLRREYGMKYVVIGVGGVIEKEDYNAYKQIGVDAIMSATGAIWNPYLAQEIWKMVNRPIG